MADVPSLLSAANKWHRNFNKPLPLGAKSRLSIVTCMDSRLIPEQMFDLGIGDAEVPTCADNWLWPLFSTAVRLIRSYGSKSIASTYQTALAVAGFQADKTARWQVIRNAGGRVTLDVIRHVHFLFYSLRLSSSLCLSEVKLRRSPLAWRRGL